MSNCSNHRKDLFGQTDMVKVGFAIGDLNYKSLAQLLSELGLKLKQDSFKDRRGGREKLADALWIAGDHIEVAAVGIEDAYRISKPFMEGKEEK